MILYAIFLRGVNVGGVKVLMKDLATLLQDAGFTQVRTLLASGNVVLGSEATDPARVKEDVERALVRKKLAAGSDDPDARDRPDRLADRRHAGFRRASCARCISSARAGLA